jgi:hypothetical protein
MTKRISRFRSIYDYLLDFTLYLIGIHSLKAEISSFHPFPHFVIRFSQVFEIYSGGMDYLLDLALSIFTKIKSLMVLLTNSKFMLFYAKKALLHWWKMREKGILINPCIYDSSSYVLIVAE